jgi:hypothetical protein
MRRELLAIFLTLQACSSTPQPHLEPIPAPSPIVVEVPTYVPLPADATAPCPKPQPRAIKTDADLLKAAMAWKVTAECNGNKLGAIENKQPPVTP